MAQELIYLTAEGYKKLKDELNHYCGEEFATRTYRVAATVTVLF